MSNKRKLRKPTKEVRLERFREQNRNRLIRDLEEGRWFRPDSTLPVSSLSKSGVMAEGEGGDDDRASLRRTDPVEPQIFGV